MRNKIFKQAKILIDITSINCLKQTDYYFLDNDLKT